MHILRLLLMKKIIASFLRQLVFWMSFFLFTRIVFILYNLGLIKNSGIKTGETLASFWHAIPLDLSTSGYFLLFPFLLLIIQTFYSPKWLNKVNLIYTTLGIILFSLLTTAELGLYPEWKTKMPYKALMYLQNPSEVFNSTATNLFILLLIIFFIQVAVGWYAYVKIFQLRIIKAPKKILFTLLFTIITFPMLVLGIRGGWQQIPINQSESYYSNHQILNLAAVNSAFNIAISVIENYKNFDKNPFEFYDGNEARNIVNNILETPKDTTIKILDIKKPNVVLIILESWSADLIESLGGEQGITPEFRKLEKEGILFTNMYATGPRSEQAMGSIFCGFPAHPISSVTVQPEKFAKLKTITHTLIDHGYHTSFYFGGQLRYGNIKGFILHNGFKKVYEHGDFDKSLPRGKLGVHDEFVLNRQLSDLDNEAEPFFSSTFTLSTHSPYDQPMEKVLQWGDNENNYINSAYYTDRSLGQFFSKAKEKEWYKNTLFIIVADHSHNSYKNWSFTSPNYHKIPMLFYGEVINKKYRGQKIDRLSNQNDLAKTLLNQLDYDSSPFKWSRDLFNPHSPEYAYYSFEEGLGWVRPNGYFVYQARLDHYSEENLPVESADSIKKEGKSFLQVLFDEYMKL